MLFKPLVLLSDVYDRKVKYPSCKGEIIYLSHSDLTNCREVNSEITSRNNHYYVSHKLSVLVGVEHNNSNNYLKTNLTC